jgi:hypothetical protein
VLLEQHDQALAAGQPFYFAFSLAVRMRSRSSARRWRRGLRFWTFGREVGEVSSDCTRKSGLFMISPLE